MTRAQRILSDEKAWMVLVATAGVLFSCAFACATPFAAVAVVAATRMRRVAGVSAVLLAWSGNQAIGYGLLHYPRTPGSFGWGLAIGMAALVAMALATLPPFRLNPLGRIVLAFVAAFAGYEVALYAASFVLGGGNAAFAPHVIARIAAINAVALAGLLAVHRLGLTLGLRLPTGRTDLVRV